MRYITDDDVRDYGHDLVDFSPACGLSTRLAPKLQAFESAERRNYSIDWRRKPGAT